MNMTKKIPLRKCSGCGEMKPKKELIRVLRTENGVIVDLTGKQNGRGAYICNSKDCFDKAKKAKSIEKALKTPIPQEVYAELEKSFE